MSDFIRIPVGAWVDGLVDFVVDNAQEFFLGLRAVFLGMYDAIDVVLSTPPFWVVVLVIGIIGLLARGWWFGGGIALALLLIAAMDQWATAMDTLSLVLVATFIALLLGIPLGIAAAKSNAFSAIVRPVLDFLQTMPGLVYLVPALLLFRVGVAPGIVATIMFAIAPAVRLTELGIRGVDREVVEAGNAFGASSARVLRQIQLPLAMPTIMAGVNQVIMLALSMVVLAGMVGAGGLGGKILEALGRLNVALAVEAGLAVVILAILLDRLTGAFGQRRGLYAALRARLAKRAQPAARAE